MIFLHFHPVNEAIQIVYKKHGETDEHGDISLVFTGGKRPQQDKHKIVGGVSESEIRASPEGEINCDKACGYRNGAGDEIRSVEIPENEIKQRRNTCREKEHKDDFGLFQRIHLNL